MYNETIERGELPTTLSKGLITLILKKIHVTVRTIVVYIFGDGQVLAAHPKPLKQWTLIAVMIGQQFILRNWKKPEESPFQEWVTELSKVATYESMS